ncbi:hypothetical protein [Actinomadura sp. NEAU-AAG7]|uniref:hypothetical protein n=1 Tax=Actinomadura sp. NEAU-AAG7 TaxID=2839640 RepID=UPI001BE44550|nr:hypothetical protein [Actinomadura sp. NEAU-AAG7]
MDDMQVSMQVSVAVMYHPSRERSARAVARGCAELSPILVPDPDPGGPPSPLRTAKRAWAACPPGATHHLVLQDDVVLAADFVTQLTGAVRLRPAHAVALYANRNSVRNSYLLRRAAALGSRWAPLSRHEYTPTLGLLLPAEHARALAEYLRAFPDDYRDDDEAVTVFCRERGVPAVGTVPSLIDHGDLPSVAGNGTHGTRHAAVFADHAGVDAGYWNGAEAAGAPGARALLPHTLELHDSRCLIRFARPAAGEPVDSLFGWYWHDWCELLGASPEAVLAGWAEHMEGGDAYASMGVADAMVFPVEAALEVWAAGYLLGVDVSADPDAAVPEVSPVFRRSVETWLDAGLAEPDRERLDAAGRAGLVETCLAGFRAGVLAGLAPAAPADLCGIEAP